VNRQRHHLISGGGSSAQASDAAHSHHNKIKVRKICRIQENMLALMGTFRGINPPDGLHGIDVAPSPAMCRAGAPGRTMQIMCHAPQLLDFQAIYLAQRSSPQKV